MSDSIKKLTDLFTKFPTIGRRTAGRFVFYLIGQSPKEIEELIGAIQELKNTIKLCSFCFQPFQHSAGQTLCGICNDPLRNKQLLCVVEKEQDLISIEATRKYKGLYFILGEIVLSKNPNADYIRIEALKDRIQKNNFSEVIIALNPTPEGKSTSILIERTLKELSTLKPSTFKLTHLAQGLPVGGELEYADQETLESAFEGRK